MAKPRIHLPDPKTAAAACADILATLPDWFGQPDANAAYQRNIVQKQTFLAPGPANPLGLIALDIHFETTAEIWVLAVRQGHHRMGLGRALMHTALAAARGQSCTRALVQTLSPRSPDPGYRATRAFYTAMGFRPLVEFNRTDPLNPMMWMERAL